MLAEMYTATQGMLARQHELDIIANNIANVNTSGFRGTNSFITAFNSALDAGLQNPLNGMVNDQSIFRGNYLSNQQGALKNTGGKFDLALEGSGFFKLETPFGTRYTRRGHFQMDSTGALTTEQGYFALDTRGQRIYLGKEKTDIASDGSIFQGETAKGTLAVVDLPNPENLVPEEDVLIASQDPNQAEIPSKARVSQGFLETSNVDVAKEMILMIEAQRSFEMNNKVIKTISTEIEQKMIQVYGQYS